MSSPSASPPTLAVTRAVEILGLAAPTQRDRALQAASSQVTGNDNCLILLKRPSHSKQPHDRRVGIHRRRRVRQWGHWCLVRWPVTEAHEDDRPPKGFLEQSPANGCAGASSLARAGPTTGLRTRHGVMLRACRDPPQKHMLKRILSAGSCPARAGHSEEPPACTPIAEPSCALSHWQVR